CLRTCDVTAMLGASRLRRACYRHLRHGCHGGRGGVQPDEEALSKAPMRDASRTWIASFPRIGNRGRHSDKSHRPESSRECDLHHSATAGAMLRSAGAGPSAYALLHAPTDDGPSQDATNQRNCSKLHPNAFSLSKIA